MATSGLAPGALTEARALVGDVAHLVRRGWRRLVGFAATYALLFGLVALVEGIGLYLAFQAQADRLTVSGVVTWEGQRSMLLQASVASLVVCVGLLAFGASAGIAVAQRLRSGAEAALGRSLARGLRRTPVVLVATLLGLALVATLAILGAFIVNVALLMLVLTPLQRRLVRRFGSTSSAVAASDEAQVGAHPRPEVEVEPAGRRLPSWCSGLRWPTVRELVVAAIPFSLAAIAWTRVLLVLPAAVAIDGGPLRALAASRRSIRGRVWPVVATVAGTVLVAGLAQLAVVAVVRLVEQDALTFAVAVLGALVVILTTAVALTVAYQAGDVPEPTADPDPGGRLASAWRGARRPRLVTTVLALAFGAVALVLPLVPATPATAAALRTYVVGSLGDEGDADPGDGTCATAGGACTLRSAVDEANEQRDGDLTSITFARSGTIALGSVLTLRSTVEIDGTGQKVVLDGGGTTRILDAQEGVTWKIVALHLTRGSATYAGGAINSSGFGTIEGSTFTANDATEVDGADRYGLGGAVFAYGTLLVRNSTFAGNIAPTKGGDLFFGGSGAIVNSTFVGSRSPISADFRLSIDNSIISGAAGGLDCTGSAEFTGSHNLANDTTCPGTPAVVPLGLNALGDHGGPVPTANLLPGSPAIGTAGATLCPPKDARGLARPIGGACDIGATEFDDGTATALVVTPSPSRPGEAISLRATVTSDEGYGVSGNVTFRDGTTVLGTSALDGSGEAVLNSIVLATGTHSLTATYVGTGGYASSTSAAKAHEVVAATTTVGVLSSKNPSAIGEAVTLTVMLQSGGLGTTTGTVTLKDGTATLATLPVVADGASFTTSALAAGTHAITAVYGGDAIHGPGTSPVLQQFVRGGAEVSLAASNATPVYANPVTLTARVTGPGGAGATSGTVRFHVDGNFHDATVNASGIATHTTTALPVGANTVHAQFLGTSGLGQSALGSTVVTVSAAPSATQLTVTPATATNYGNSVTLAARVTVSGTPTPVSGAVAFKDGATVLAQVALDGTGRAQLVTSALGVGNRSLTATFVPGTGLAASTSTAVTHQVTGVGTVVTLAGNRNPTVTGQAVTLTATVDGTGTDAVPTGIVAFRDGTTVLGSAGLDSTGTARLTVGALAVGTHPLTAAYAGGPGFAAATSPALSQVVAKGSTTLDLTAPTLTTYGDSTTITASATAVAPAAGTPTGTITFRRGTTVLGTAPLVDGTATLLLARPAVGTYALEATYAGSSAFTGSTASGATEVAARPATLTVSTDRSRTTYGDDLTITVRATSTGGLVPTGSVSIFGPNQLRTVVLDADGVGTVTLDTLSAGDRTIEAILDSPNFRASIARTSVVVEKATPTATLAVSPLPVTTGRQSIISLTLANEGGNRPSGLVTFFDGATELGSQGLVGGESSIGRVLPIGSRRLRATYPGDANHLPVSSGVLSVEVGRYVPTFTFFATPNPAVDAQPVVLRTEVRSLAGQPAATGTVTFRRNGFDLGTVAIDGSGVASLSVSTLTRGTNPITAAYSGDGTYGEVVQSVDVLVQAPSTVTELTSAKPTAKVGEPVTYTARVTAPNTTITPSGLVQLSVDGVARGFAVPTGTGNAVTATFTQRIDTAGPHTVTAEFRPGTSATTGSTTSIDQVIERFHTTTALTATPTAGPAGTTFRFGIATVEDDPEDPAPRIIGGPTVVSDGTRSCTIYGATGTCDLRIAAAGTRTISASYAGDDTFAPSVGELTVEVGSGTPGLTAFARPVSDEYPDAWITGEEVRASWTLTGPTSGTVEVRTSGGRRFCTSTVESGSCIGTFGLDELAAKVDGRAPAQPLTVRFLGTTDWDAVSTVVGRDKPLVGCFPIGATTSTPDRGTAAIVDGLGCNDGTGYLENNLVTVQATPGPGYVVSGFAPEAFDQTGDRARFLVTRGEVVATEGISVRFARDCVSLTVELQGPANFSSSPSSSLCEQRPSVAPPFNVTTWFPRGTTGSTALVGLPYRVAADGTRTPTKEPAVAYRLDGSDSAPALGGSAYRLAFLMTEDRTLHARFGAPCFTLALTTSGGTGTATPTNPTSCVGPLGQRGYVPGQSVGVQAKASGVGTFKAWEAAGGLPAGLGVDGAIGSFAIVKDTTLNARFATCFRLTTGIAGHPEDGSIAVDTAPTCANREPGWYAEGDKVKVTVSSSYFQGWGADQPSETYLNSSPSRTTAGFTMDRDRSAVAKLSNANYCAPLSVSVEPAGAGTGVVKGLSDYPCPAGQYGQSSSQADALDPCYAQYLNSIGGATGGTRQLIEDNYVACLSRSTFKPGTKVRRPIQTDVVFEATAKAGKPLLGWSYTTSDPPWRNDPKREAYNITDPVFPRSSEGTVGAQLPVDIYGKTTATAWVCQRIDAGVTVTGGDGESRQVRFSLGDEYLAVDPAPNCPLAKDAWTVGTTVRVAPTVDRAGYDFQGWGGVYTGPNEVAVVDLDGASESVRLTAGFTAKCFELERTPRSLTKPSVEPNCPGAKPEGDWYVGGTRVGLTILDRGNDFVFQNWSGDVGTSANPSYVVMDGDKSVTANWREKNVAEKAITWVEGAVSTVGTFITEDVVDYVVSLEETAKIVTAVLAKGVQIIWDGFFDDTFGLAGLPLNALRLINLAIDDPGLADVIDEYEKVLGTVNLPGMLLGCATDSILGLLDDGAPKSDLDKGIGGAKDAKELAMAMKDFGDTIKEMEGTKKADSGALGLAVDGGVAAYGISRSFAENRILTKQPELNNTVKKCIEDAMPTRLMDGLSGI
ncbi:hypothetical protein BH10ACT1_BH10ACT1_31370 [soil metagenome]